MRYSGAEAALGAFARRHGIPVVETIAGKGALSHDDPVHAGPIGIIGSTSANTLAEEADVVVAIGTRLQDFTTGSWTAFARDATFIAINAARFDATKHRALAVVGDARETLEELTEALGDWSANRLDHARPCSASGTRCWTSTRRPPTSRCRRMRRWWRSPTTPPVRTTR